MPAPKHAAASTNNKSKEMHEVQSENDNSNNLMHSTPYQERNHCDINKQPLEYQSSACQQTMTKTYWVSFELK